jgi:hypothetical protein
VTKQIDFSEQVSDPESKGCEYQVKEGVFFKICELFYECWDACYTERSRRHNLSENDLGMTFQRVFKSFRMENVRFKYGVKAHKQC